MQWLIMFGALILRLPFLNQSLWLDEAIEALALMGRQGPLFLYALADYQPPLYHVIAYGITHLLGYDEIVLRLPGFIAGLITVYLVMKIGTLLANKHVGYLVGMLAATNPLLIYYAQEGRTYGVTACFASASFYFLLKLLRNRQAKMLTKVAYILFTASMIWTSYLSWFFLLAQGVYVLRQKRYDLTKLQAVAALTWLWWLPSFFDSLAVGQYTLTTSDGWGKVVGGLSWKSLPLTWVKFMIGRITFDNKILYAVIVGLLVLLHGYILKKIDWSKYRLLLYWLIPPVILGILTAAFLPVYSYFRVLFVLPAYLLLLSLGLDKLKSLTLTSLVISAQLTCLMIFWFTPHLHREDWRSLAHDLQVDITAPIAMPSDEQAAGLLYYGIPKERIFEPSNQEGSGERIYYIRYAEDLFDPSQHGPAKLREAGYTLTRQTTYTGIAIDIYENSH
jgi:hypothetical protein